MTPEMAHVDTPDEDDTDDYVDYRAIPISTKAINAFVLSLIALVTGPAGFLFGIPAVIIGHRAVSDIRTGEVRGWNLNQWALAIGYFALFASVVYAVSYFTTN